MSDQQPTWAGPASIGVGVFALVSSCCCIFGCCGIFQPILAITAIALGALGMQQAQAAEQEPTLAQAGIGIGVVALLLGFGLYCGSAFFGAGLQGANDLSMLMEEFS